MADDFRKEMTKIILDALPSYTQDSGVGFLVLVEAPVYEAVMRLTNGNQVHAAKVLGVSKGALRNKLKYYFGTTKVGNACHKIPSLNVNKEVVY